MRLRIHIVSTRDRKPGFLLELVDLRAVSSPLRRVPQASGALAAN
jgi:hypothetical protein